MDLYLHHHKLTRSICINLKQVEHLNFMLRNYFLRINAITNIMYHLHGRNQLNCILIMFSVMYKLRLHNSNQFQLVIFHLIYYMLMRNMYSLHQLCKDLCVFYIRIIIKLHQFHHLMNQYLHTLNCMQFSFHNYQIHHNR